LKLQRALLQLTVNLATGAAFVVVPPPVSPVPPVPPVPLTEPVIRRKRFGVPAVTFFTMPTVAAEISACVTSAGDAPGFEAR
jgi:hypothetical protein